MGHHEHLVPLQLVQQNNEQVFLPSLKPIISVAGIKVPFTIIIDGIVGPDRRVYQVVRSSEETKRIVAYAVWPFVDCIDAWLDLIEPYKGRKWVDLQLNSNDSIGLQQSSVGTPRAQISVIYSFPRVNPLLAWLSH